MDKYFHTRLYIAKKGILKKMAEAIKPTESIRRKKDVL